MNRSGLNGFGSTLRAEQMAYRITGIIRSLNDEAERKPNKRMSFVEHARDLHGTRIHLRVFMSFQRPSET